MIRDEIAIEVNQKKPYYSFKNGPRTIETKSAFEIVFQTVIISQLIILKSE